jgi:hypothetical protein
MAIMTAGCGGDDTEDSGPLGAGGWGGEATTPLAIVGTYTDDYATDHLVTSTTWTQSSSYGTSVFDISQYDNEAEFLVAQNDAGNDYYPDLWSRFDWTTYQGELYFCQGTYDAASEADALATPRATAMDPTAVGSCGTFSWSRLVPLGAGGSAGSGG